MASLLVLGAGYVGAALAAYALRAGDSVTLADNWHATDRSQLDELERAGARVVTVDIRDRAALDALLADDFDRLYMLAAQASRPLSIVDPDYTEETNVLGVRRVAEAVTAGGGPAVVFASSLHVYGGGLTGDIGPGHPYGHQGDLAHLSKVYGELCLRLYADRHGLGVALLRLAIVYGRSPVEHDRPESVTVVEKFRRLAAAGQPLPVDDGGRATIGAIHLADATRILHETHPEPGTVAENVVAETVTVSDVAALAEGREPTGGATWRFVSPYDYSHGLAEYLAP